MDDNGIHGLSAAFALDALDPRETRFYTRHLDHCENCRAAVAAFAETAAALAYLAPPVEPPAELRQRIVAAARAESAGARWQARWAGPASIAVAAAVGGLVVWGVALHSQPGSTEAQHSVRLSGASGAVVRSGDGDATLVVAGLRGAPRGETYEAWVMHDGTALPAGLFQATADMTVVHLTRRVPQGATVGVTIEPASGARSLIRRPLFTSAPA